MLAEKLRAAASSSPAWDVANVVYQGSPINLFYVGAQESTPTTVFFKPDGLKMYITGDSATARLYEYDLSTAWDVSTAIFARYVSIFFSYDDEPQSIFFSPSGTKLYMVGTFSNAVYEYDVPLAWDISTASYAQTFSVAAQDTEPRGLFFKPDGTKMYVVGAVNNDIFEYNLTTAWDISTASYLQSKDFGAQTLVGNSVFFTSDGLAMYILGSGNTSVYRYALSTAWDVTTALYTLQSFYVGAQASFTEGLFFKPDGSKMYMIGGTTYENVWQYDISTAWDITTASFSYPTSYYFSVSAKEATPNGIFFKPDGLKMYVVGSSSDRIHEYNLSTAWDINTATFFQSGYPISPVDDSIPRGLYFSPDGLRVFFVGASKDKAFRYGLSTAWDISSRDTVQSIYVSAQTTDPNGIFFKPDGTKMYIVGGSSVFEYNLSIAWDLTTASFIASKNVSPLDYSLTGVSFDPSGFKMYVLGLSGDDVNEYDLSTAWSVASASYTQSCALNNMSLDPTGFYFKPDGMKLYVVSSLTDAILGYNFV